MDCTKENKGALNALGKLMAATDPDKIRLDGNVKRILGYKPLLARIFKEVVEECREYSCEQIERFIEGEVVIDEEVHDMCTYAQSIENKGIRKGISQGITQGLDRGLKALVSSLKVYINDFDSLYDAIRKNEDYSDVTKKQVRKYF